MCFKRKYFGRAGKIEFLALLDQTNGKKIVYVEYVQFLNGGPPKGVDWKRMSDDVAFAIWLFDILRLQNSRLYISNSYTPEKRVQI